ncbi:sensor histidine kinase [Shivajiella indica]|uniref:Sensor histidine kinase n=1 Tax=Shivajiella indica TaxID=872115 RepID=A0ABW5BED5_9BACT
MTEKKIAYPDSLSKKVFASATIFTSLRKFLILNLGIAAVLMLIQCPACLLSIEGLKGIFPDFIFSFLMSSSISFGGFYVDGYYDRRISWIQHPVKRLVLTAGTYLVYCFIISFILTTLYVLVTIEGVNLNNISWIRMIKNTIYPIMVALFIISIFISRSWLYEWRNAAIEAEQLKSEKLASQYQSLKDQLNPHFLFNSLNVLSNLVYESPDKSAEFIQQLSKIYRYVLDVQHEQLVSLKDEVDFAEHYLSLQKIRFENSLEYFIDVAASSNLYLPPLSLQLILENAIKHNIASKEKPLKIIIEQVDNSLFIRNILQSKLTEKLPSTGIGLSNIKKRYALLSNEKPKITQTDKEFIVELPLLKISHS